MADEVKRLREVGGHSLRDERCLRPLGGTWPRDRLRA